MIENTYHSLEVSEVEEETSQNRRIIVRDLEWRSDSVSVILIKVHFLNCILIHFNFRSYELFLGNILTSCIIKPRPIEEKGIALLMIPSLLQMKRLLH